MIGFMQLQNLNNSKTKSDLFLLTNDNRELNRYFNEIFTFKKGCLGQLTRLKNLKAMASGLLIYINETK